MNTFSSIPLFAALLLCAEVHCEIAKSDPAQIEADKKALAPVLQYIGGWRGAGLPKEGAKEGWSEEADWSFDLKGARAAIVFSSDKNKYFKAGRLEPAVKPGEFKFSGTLPDGKKEEWTGAFEKGDLTLNNSATTDGRPARMVFNVYAKGSRLVVALQKKMAGDRYSPLCEIGYTRIGSGFGKQENANECIITGGQGKIAVSYKGKTYYVCCGGCKEAFEANPEKEIAAYLKRKEEEKAKEKK